MLRTSAIFSLAALAAYSFAGTFSFELTVSQPINQPPQHFALNQSGAFHYGAWETSLSASTFENKKLLTAGAGVGDFKIIATSATNPGTTTAVFRRAYRAFASASVGACYLQLSYRSYAKLSGIGDFGPPTANLTGQVPGTVGMSSVVYSTGYPAYVREQAISITVSANDWTRQSDGTWTFRVTFAKGWTLDLEDYFQPSFGFPGESVSKLQGDEYIWLESVGGEVVGSDPTEGTGGGGSGNNGGQPGGGSELRARSSPGSETDHLRDLLGFRPINL